MEPGETIVDGVIREAFEETNAEVAVGNLALTYEFDSHKQSGDYSENESHGLHLIFECTLINHSIPRLPHNPDLHQVAVKWIPINELEFILLIPNISKQIKEYVKYRESISLIEDHQLERLNI